jgi:aldehyde:ferredoxin oxidoreductase
MPQVSFRLSEVDLSSGTANRLEVSQDEGRAFLGGSSLAARILYPLLSIDLDPLASEAPLLLVTGPLTGTAGPAVGRMVICAKSPATQLWGESNIGGFLGRELRAAGFDGVLIRGRTFRPSFLWIHDGEIELRDASHLWGKADTYETQSAIKRELKDSLTRVAAIGRAGEVGLPFALILCDHGRVAGRTGMGAVMGAKNLKAIAIHGTGELPLALPEEFNAVRRSANIALKGDNVSRAMRELGTASAGDYFDYLGEMPKRYFTRATFDGAEKVSGASVAESILSGVSTCHGCVIACGRRVQLEDGLERKGPEYETIVGFGPNLLIDDLHAITRLGELCDRYGMDTISLSNTIGLTLLLASEGLLSGEGADGGLAWGDAAVVERLVHQTARREGLGALIAKGARQMAIDQGVPEMAAQVNGLEMAYHDPRGATGMALVYSTSPRGACHNQSDYFMVDIGQTADELGIHLHGRLAGAEKSVGVARHQDWRTVANALVLCYFANVPSTTVLALTNAVTGFDYTLEQLMQVGERAWNLKRAINVRLGLDASNDRLPAHILRALPDSPSVPVDLPLQHMLDAYYLARGWDGHTGKPLPETLRRLGLDDVISDLWPRPEPSIA